MELGNETLCKWTVDGTCYEVLPSTEASNTDEFTTPWVPLSPASYAVATVILSASLLISLPVNLLVIWVVMKTPILRSKAVNMLIVNLCLFDLVASSIDLPLIWLILHLKLSSNYNHKWICNWQLFIHTMSISGQIVSFVSVGYERYHTVSNPFDKEKVRKITHCLVVSCWLIAALVATLEMYFAPDTIGYNYCIRSSRRTGHLGIISIMLPFGAVCFCLVAYFYGKIVWLVRKHCKSVNTTCRNPMSLGTGTDLSNGSELPSIYGEVCVLDSKTRSLGKRRIEAETAKKSFFVIVSFVAFTLPYPFSVIVENLFSLPHYRSFYELQYCLNILSLLSSLANALVYGLSNKQFRDAFRKICHRYHRLYSARQ